MVARIERARESNMRLPTRKEKKRKRTAARAFPCPRPFFPSFAVARVNNVIKSHRRKDSIEQDREEEFVAPTIDRLHWLDFFFNLGHREENELAPQATSLTCAVASL